MQVKERKCKEKSLLSFFSIKHFGIQKRKECQEDLEKVQNFFFNLTFLSAIKIIRVRVHELTLFLLSL